MQQAPLKLDFKIDEHGIIRIIDLGNGFSAGTRGFEDTPLSAQIVSDMHEATGATLATVFGELPYDVMQPRSIHVPLVLRKHPSAGHSLMTDDLPPDIKRILPYSEAHHISAYVSIAWGKQKETIITAPIALLAVEMHKALWYFLMQKHMTSAEQQTLLYWSNDISPTEINLSPMNLQHGSFIKIIDRSVGGSGEVYYAKDKDELLKTLAQLHEEYNKSTEQFKKHLFVIEPAYVTLKQHQERDYNVTGRAFVTLTYDKDNKNLGIKIAAAKWIFPLAAMQEKKTQDQMLSNVKHSIKMLNLTAEELEKLSSGILSCSASDSM